MGSSSSKNGLSRKPKTMSQSNKPEDVMNRSYSTSSGLNPLKKQITHRDKSSDDTWNGPSTVKYVIGVDFGTTYSGFGIIQVTEGNFMTLLQLNSLQGIHRNLVSFFLIHFIRPDNRFIYKLA